MAKDPAILAHQEWLGYVQPSGLVVSIPGDDRGARLRESEHLLRTTDVFLSALPTDRDGEPVPEIANFPEFARSVFGWAPEDLYGAPGAPALPETLEAPLPEYGETLRPTYALHEFPADGSRARMDTADRSLAHGNRPRQRCRHGGAPVAGQPAGTLRAASARDRHRHRPAREWPADSSGVRSPNRIERLHHIQSGGHGEGCRAADLCRLARIAVLGAHVRRRERASSGDPGEQPQIPERRLDAAWRARSWKRSTNCCAASRPPTTRLHGEIAARHPGSATRTTSTPACSPRCCAWCFVLYAEDRGLLSTDPVYANYYSVTGLYERLRADAGRYPDTMYQRYGAWAQLLALFRLVYEGGSHGGMRIPAREGYLFDPDRYPFLEGRRQRSRGAVHPARVRWRPLPCALEADGSGWRAAQLSHARGRADR